MTRTLLIYDSNFASGNVVSYRWTNPPGGKEVSATVNNTGQISVSFNPGGVPDTIYVKVLRFLGKLGLLGRARYRGALSVLTLR